MSAWRVPLAYRRRRAVAWTVLAVLLLACRLPAASPRDELLRYVPDQTGFCLVVQNLRGQSGDLLASPFVRDWNKSAFATTLAASAELKQLHKVEQYLIKNLGVGWADLRDDVLGDAFVFAYRPGPAGKQDQEQGLFLVRARNARTLASLVQKLNALQKKTGELKELVDREYKGVKYVRRVEAKSTSYYLLRGEVLLFSGQEAFLQQAVERDKDLPGDARPPLARQLEELGLDRALLALTLNPRVLDDAIAGKVGSDSGAKTFAACWKALQGVGLGVFLDRDLRISLTIKARTDQLPAPARRFLASAGRPSEVWPAFPDNALFAAGGRLDAPALHDLLGKFLSRTGKEALRTGLEQGLGAMLGKDVIKEVLPALGPDWGLCVTAPPAQSKHWAPRMVFALRTAPGESNDPIDLALFTNLHSWAQLLVLGHNKQDPGRPLTLRTIAQDKVKIRYFQGDRTFPPGIQPAFALKAGYLLLATSPAEVRGFKIGPASGLLPSAGVPLVRISLKDLRAYLKDRRDGLAEALARKDNIAGEKAREKIDGLRASLESVDRLELSQKTAPGQFSLTLTVQPGQPLKK